MNAIWKYELPLTNAQPIVVAMPFGARVLTAQMQAGALVAWAAVDPDDDRRVRRTFSIVGTGHREVPENGRHVGTVQLHGGTLVLHVFVDD